MRTTTNVLMSMLLWVRKIPHTIPHCSNLPDLDGWDVAQAQLKANGGPSLMTPPWKQTQDTLNSDVQRLLKNFPTLVV